MWQIDASYKYLKQTLTITIGTLYYNIALQNKKHWYNNCSSIEVIDIEDPSRIFSTLRNI